MAAIVSTQPTIGSFLEHPVIAGLKMHVGKVPLFFKIDLSVIALVKV